MKGFWQKLTIPVDLVVRSQEIGIVFSTYGLAGSLKSLGFEFGKRGLVWVGATNAKNVPLDSVFGRNLAMTFAKLGPTFIKLGQILATRPDFVGEAVAEELKVLFDRVPSISFRKIQKILRSELGKSNIKKHIESIDPEPLASASLSQTHRAVLKDGSPVILKVQKTGVGKTVRTDLLLLEALVTPIHAVYPKWQLREIFRDFKQATLREIDYREEAKNIDQFRKNYRKLISRSDIVFPRYFPELSTERVIALEPMHGKKVAELRKGSTVARTAANLGLAAVLEQIFDHGFFHADPHAGNLFFLEDEGQLGFIDLGLVGQLEHKDKQKFLKVVLAILNRDRERLAKALFDLGAASKRTDFAKFEKSIQDLIDEIKKTGVDNVRMENVVSRLLQIARKNEIHIPNRYIMMIRSCLIVEGLAKSLDPSISVFKVATPIVAKSLLKTYHPINILRRFF